MTKGKRLSTFNHSLHRSKFDVCFAFMGTSASDFDTRANVFQHSTTVCIGASLMFVLHSWEPVLLIWIQGTKGKRLLTFNHSLHGSKFGVSMCQRWGGEIFWNKSPPVLA